MLRPRLRCLLVLVLAGAVAGCGSASDEGTQPRTDVSTFEQGDFDDIPLLPTSEPLSPPNEEDGTVARSYVVRDTAPSEVLDFYVEQLAEAELVAEPVEIGVNTFRGRWQLDQGRILTVSATAANNLDTPADFSEGIETFTQYSLSLSPAAGG
jgi:hypothetical protein